MNTVNPFPFAALSVHDQQEEILTRVSPERDRLTDDDHRSLDEKLIKALTLGLLRQFNVQPHWPGLLSNITLDDEQLVTLKTQEAEELLSKQPLIKDFLEKTWKGFSFKEVRQLHVLWPVVEDTPKGIPGQSEQNVGLTKKALESAWRATYAGNNDYLLFDNINGLPRRENPVEPYSNQIAIVQSSGTGKSRMVHEQANLVFTIPFNLRKLSDSKDLAFPVPDDAVRDYLVKPVSNEHELETKYLKFLGSVFRRVYDELEKCQEALNAKKTDAGGLARWWSRHLDSVRTDLYKTVVDGADEPLENLSEIRKNHEELLAKRRSEYHLDDGDMAIIVEFAAAQAARDALEKLILKVDSWPGSKEIKLVIYFDETHPLMKTVPEKRDRTLYDVLRSCFNQFLALPMFCIFISTNPSLAQYVPPQPLSNSARFISGNAALHAPITETPFDCCEDLMVRPGELTMDDISTIQFMAKFGRPLFWALLRGAGVTAPHVEADILYLAREKLTASHRFGCSSDSARLAVLDVQLSLDFEPRRRHVQLKQASLVESHMRIAYSIPDHREYLQSGYPSEPLLAEAAAQHLRMWRKKNRFFVVNTLTDILRDGLLDRGKLGELTGRHLLLDAYHRAVEIEAYARNWPLNFSAGCRLITFIEALFTAECANIVLNSTPDNIDGTDGNSNKFKDVFKDALVCFTHFGKMVDDTGVTSTAAWAAFIRHMAIMCRNGQRFVDCIIPVVLQKGRLCEHIMTGLLIQFTPRRDSAYSFDEANNIFFPKMLEECTHNSSVARHRPYVTLIMELEVQPTLREEAMTLGPTIFQDSSKKISTSNKHCEADSKTEGYSRYNVFAYGCSSTVYRGIDAAQHKYAILLNSRDFLVDHPRSSAESHKAIRRMKPFWNGGEDCYHWVERDNILHDSVSLPTMEFGVGN